jgi:hypothetical protein
MPSIIRRWRFDPDGDQAAADGTRPRPMLGNGPLTSHHLCSLFVASAPLIENKEGLWAEVSGGLR